MVGRFVRVASTKPQTRRLIDEPCPLRNQSSTHLDYLTGLRFKCRSFERVLERPQHLFEVIS